MGHFPSSRRPESGDRLPRDRCAGARLAWTRSARWRARAVQGDFNATTDRGVHRRRLPASQSVRLVARAIRRGLQSLVTGIRARSVCVGDPAHVVSRSLQAKRINDTGDARLGFAGVPERWGRRPETPYPVGTHESAFRDVANRATDQDGHCRPGRSSLEPHPDKCGSHTSLAAREGARRGVSGSAILSFIPFDWYARCVVELHLNFHLLNGLPVPNPSGPSTIEDLAGHRRSQVGSRPPRCRFEPGPRPSGYPSRRCAPRGEPAPKAELDAVVASCTV